MLSLSIYPYLFVSVGQYWLPLVLFQFLSFSYPRLFYLLFRPLSAIPIFVFQYLPLSVVLLFVSVCRSCLSLAVILSSSCLSVCILSLSSFAYRFAILWLAPFLCGSKTIALLYTVYTYLLPGHLVGTEDGPVPASPFYIVIPALSE